METRATVAFGLDLHLTSTVAQGEDCRAVIVAMFLPEVPMWSDVQTGADLLMYEGSKVCGVGHVLWRIETRMPLPDSDADRFLAWLEGASPSRALICRGY